MLNSPIIKKAMRKRGLNQSSLAQACDVSREAVSRWLACESIPRPRKLKQLASALELPLDALFVPRYIVDPIAELRLGAEAVLTAKEKDVLQDSARRLREVEPFLPCRALFTSVLDEPNLAPEYLQDAARHVKRGLGLAHDAPLTTEQLVDLNLGAGTLLLPTPWTGNRPGQRHAVRASVTAKSAQWLIFGTNLKCVDLDTNLAHLLGRQYARNADDEVFREAFASRFAQVLCTPGVLRHPDPDWTVKQKFFGDKEPETAVFVKTCVKAFNTPIYEAITEFQRYNGGRNPAFIQSLLNVDLGRAYEISVALWPAATSARA